MIDYTEIRKIIETELHNNFTTCVVKYENVGIPPEVLAWVSIYDKQGDSEAVGMGSIEYLTHGNLFFGIFTPKDTGTENARLIADDLAALLGNRELEGINLSEPELHGNPGSDPENPWYQMNLVIPYVVVMGSTAGC